MSLFNFFKKKENDNNKRETLEIIKEHFILLLGTGLFVYSLFSFSSNRYYDSCDSCVNISPFCHHSATFYYYDDLTLILLTIGAILAVIGLLKIRERRHKDLT
jgi:hypothetical protein